jgi:hypothetical protein
MLEIRQKHVQVRPQSLAFPLMLAVVAFAPVSLVSVCCDVFAH